MCLYTKGWCRALRGQVGKLDWFAAGYWKLNFSLCLIVFCYLIFSMITKCDIMWNVKDWPCLTSDFDLKVVRRYKADTKMWQTFKWSGRLIDERGPMYLSQSGQSGGVGDNRMGCKHLNPISQFLIIQVYY